MCNLTLTNIETIFVVISLLFGYHIPYAGEPVCDKWKTHLLSHEMKKSWEYVIICKSLLNIELMLDSTVKTINFRPTNIISEVRGYGRRNNSTEEVWGEKNNSIKANVYSTNEYIFQALCEESENSLKMASFHFFIVVLWQQKCGSWWWFRIKSFRRSPNKPSRGKNPLTPHAFGLKAQETIKKLLKVFRTLKRETTISH